MELEIQANHSFLKSDILLNGSKSISNRVLIIYALCNQHFEIHNLSNANDTVTLLRLLSNEGDFLHDAADAGTTFRFMAAYLAFRPKKQLLTGSDRMLERPVGALVEALRTLGAQVSYLRKEGFPPLQFAEPIHNQTDTVEIAADVSSQFISALLLIAPTLPLGLTIVLKGTPVSAAYIQMTLNLMQEFGIEYKWDKNANVIAIKNQPYQGKFYSVESDWSAASYYYAMAALCPKSDLILRGLNQNSNQGDSCLIEIMKKFGVETVWLDDMSFRLERSEVNIDFFEYDFINCPDLAQTFAVLCAALNIPAQLTGLQTLKIKETDRILALKTELEKLGAQIECNHNSLTINKGIDKTIQNPLICTYRDHRMAMAFTPLALVLDYIRFEDKNVVKKSYPNFWTDLQKMGFQIQPEKDKKIY